MEDPIDALVEDMNPSDLLRAAVEDQSPAPEDEIPQLITKSAAEEALDETLSTENDELTQEEFEELSGESDISEDDETEETEDGTDDTEETEDSEASEETEDSEASEEE